LRHQKERSDWSEAKLLTNHNAPFDSGFLLTLPLLGQCRSIYFFPFLNNDARPENKANFFYFFPFF
jgi:hypothetical protein